MELRDAVETDLEAVHAINQAEIPAVNDITRTQLTWFFAHAASLRVAVVDGAVAGFVLGLGPGLAYESLNYAWFSRRYRDFFYIDRLAVGPAWRRRGIASALYADAADRARAAAAPLLACEVNVRPRNEVSLAFHAAQGFVEVGRQDTDGGIKTVAMMTRALGNAERGPAPGAAAGRHPDGA